MFPYPLGVVTLLQGLYSMVWIVVLMDVLSPTFDLRDVSKWSAAETTLFFGALLITTFAVGVAMHTVSRNVFRKLRDAWDVQVVTSPGIRSRMAEYGLCRPSGGPSLDEVHAAEGEERVRKAGEFMHALDYVLQIRAPHVYESVRVYRDQYRLARAFILPSLILALVIPFWEPLPAGHVGSFPLISIQIFFMGIFFTGACMYAFRDRSYRYTLSRLRVFWTVENEARSTASVSPSRLAAVQ
jgi:hypothetical protein